MCVFRKARGFASLTFQRVVPSIGVSYFVLYNNISCIALSLDIWMSVQFELIWMGFGSIPYEGHNLKNAER